MSTIMCMYIDLEDTLLLPRPTLALRVDGSHSTISLYASI